MIEYLAATDPTDPGFAFKVGICVVWALIFLCMFCLSPAPNAIQRWLTAPHRKAQALRQRADEHLEAVLNGDADKAMYGEYPPVDLTLG